MIPIPTLTVRTTTVAVPTQIQGQVRKSSISHFDEAKNQISLLMKRVCFESISYRPKFQIFAGVTCDQNYDEENRKSNIRILSKFSKTMLNLNWLLGELIQLRI